MFLYYSFVCIYEPVLLYELIYFALTVCPCQYFFKRKLFKAVKYDTLQQQNNAPGLDQPKSLWRCAIKITNRVQHESRAQRTIVEQVSGGSQVRRKV